MANPYDPLQASQQPIGATSTTPGTGEVASAFQATSESADVAQRDVTPDQLVQSQITSILDGENPYIKQAERKAMEYANSRGVLNSSIAANAGRAAAIEAALPIAQQDAGVFETASRDNQSAFNQANLQDAQLSSQVNMQNAESQNQLLQDYVNYNQERDIMQQEAAIKLDFAEADAAIRERLAAVEQGYAVELQTLQSEYGLLENQQTVTGSMYNDALKSLATLLSSEDLAGDVIKERANSIIQNLKAGLEFTSGVVGSPGVVDYGDTYGTAA